MSPTAWNAANKTAPATPPANATAPTAARQRRRALSGRGNSGEGVGAIAAYRVGPTTSTVPNAERAWSSGRYMSSTVAEGCVKTPGDTALTV
jgi:hypothetical protein